MGRVLLVRHAETEWNRERRVQGWAPIGITDEGREQAREAGAVLSTTYDIDRIVTSDLRRTVETTRELGGPLDVPVERDARWRERDFGALQGLSYTALFDEHPEFSLRHSGHWAAAAAPESGESWLDARRRTLDAWDELRSTLDEAIVAVVTHGGPIMVVLAAVLGLDARASVTKLSVPNLSVSEIVDDEETEIVRRSTPLVD